MPRKGGGNTMNKQRPPTRVLALPVFAAALTAGVLNALVADRCSRRGCTACPPGLQPHQQLLNRPLRKLRPPQNSESSGSCVSPSSDTFAPVPHAGHLRAIDADGAELAIDSVMSVTCT